MFRSSEFRQQQLTGSPGTLTGSVERKSFWCVDTCALIQHRDHQSYNNLSSAARMDSVFGLESSAELETLSSLFSLSWFVKQDSDKSIPPKHHKQIASPD